MLLVQISFHADFSVFTVLISRIYFRICRKLPADAILKQVLLSSIKSAFMIDISKSDCLPTFRNDFSVFLIFIFVPGVFCCQHFSGLFRV